MHRYKPKRVYQEKTNNAFRGGIPDDYYEANGRPGILRVEYKYVSKVPKELNLITQTTKPALSRLQQLWLNRAHANGHLVAVIVGTRAGGIILTDRRWDQPITKSYFEKHMMERKAIMDWIELQVTQDAYKRSERDCRKPGKTQQDAVSELGNLAALVPNG